MSPQIIGEEVKQSFFLIRDEKKLMLGIMFASKRKVALAPRHVTSG